MKRLLVSILIVLLLVVGVNWGIILVEQGQFDSEQYAEGVEPKIGGERSVEISPSKHVHKGDLLLVNKEHAVHEEGIKEDIVNLSDHADLIEGAGLLNQNIYLSKQVAQQFKVMVKDAAKQGVNHFIISSGYRDFEKQKQLYDEHGSDYALPAGKSEHNLGLSLDIGSTEMEMSKAEEGKWLQNNAWKYGFILRYPSNKTELTGIKYEPWHFRYVGLPHSAIMYKNDWVLEEYLEYLKSEEHISVEALRKKYNISYYPASKKSMHIKVGQDYSISGDNVTGIIVTSR